MSSIVSREIVRPSTAISTCTPLGEPARLARSGSSMPVTDERRKTVARPALHR
jgi:hypothetical protein